MSTETATKEPQLDNVTSQRKFTQGTPLINLKQSHTFYEHVFYNKRLKRVEPTEFRLIRCNRLDVKTFVGFLDEHRPELAQLVEEGYTELKFSRGTSGERDEQTDWLRVSVPELRRQLHKHGRQGYEHVQASKPEIVSFWGTLDDVEDKLVRLNLEGYGVYVVVNRIKRRAIEKRFFTRDYDISGVRAFFVDLDKQRNEGRESNLGVLQQAPLYPSLIVQSSARHKQHGYWLVTGFTPREVEVVQWTLAQRLGGDVSVCNPANLMRLAGFAHTKAEPVLTRLLEDDGAVYTREQFIKAFALNLSPGKQKSQKLKPTPKKSVAPRGPRRKAQVPGGDIPEEVALALWGCTTIKGYLRALTQVWPIIPSFRHELALRAASDLYRHGLTKKAAEGEIRRLCKQAGDEEVEDRLKAVRTTYRRIGRGEAVAGLTGKGASKTNYPAPAWGVDLRTLPPKERAAEAKRRILQALALTEVEANGSRQTSARKLAEQTGVNKSTVSKILTALRTEGEIRTAHDTTTRSTRVWLVGGGIVSIGDYSKAVPSLLAKCPKERERLERMRSGHAAERRTYRAVNNLLDETGTHRKTARCDAAEADTLTEAANRR